MPVHRHQPFFAAERTAPLYQQTVAGYSRSIVRLLRSSHRTVRRHPREDSRFPGFPFVHQSETKEIDHIGLKLFAPDMVEKQHTPIFHFVERYMLELLLTQTDADALQRLQMERIKLSSDIPMTGKLRKDLQNIIAAFSNRLSFLLSNAGNRYKLLCMDGNRTILSIEFPARYELITGYTKPEAENAVYMSLLTHKSTSVPQPAATDFREKSQASTRQTMTIT